MAQNNFELLYLEFRKYFDVIQKPSHRINNVPQSLIINTCVGCRGYCSSCHCKYSPATHCSGFHYTFYVWNCIICRRILKEHYQKYVYLRITLVIVPVILPPKNSNPLYDWKYWAQSSFMKIDHFIFAALLQIIPLRLRALPERSSLTISQPIPQSGSQTAFQVALITETDFQEAGDEKME